MKLSGSANQGRFIRVNAGYHSRSVSPFSGGNIDHWQKTNLYNKSLNFLEGKGVAKDEVQAFRLNADAAEADYAEAILAMGWFYLNGIGVEKDVSQAIRWYRKSARKGELAAMFSLGQIAYDCEDYSGAIQWFKRAIEAGHARSIYWLGKLYWRGQGVKKNKKQALRYFHLAASRKVPTAQRVLRFLSKTSSIILSLK